MKSLQFTNNSETDKVIQKIAEAASAKKVEAYLVGGYVRDRLLNKESKDIDITVIGDAIKFAEFTAGQFNTELNAVYKRFGTALLLIPGSNEQEVKVEFASARKESYKSDSRKPDVEFSDLRDDLSRRDFTVNALAVKLCDSNNKSPLANKS